MSAVTPAAIATTGFANITAVNWINTAITAGITVPLKKANAVINAPNTTNKGPTTAVTPAINKMVFFISGDRFVNLFARVESTDANFVTAPFNSSPIASCIPSKADFNLNKLPCKVSSMIAAILEAEPPAPSYAVFKDCASPTFAAIIAATVAPRFPNNLNAVAFLFVEVFISSNAPDSV